MEKHAYLIIAHNEFNVLKYLVMSIDDYNNDIYLHIDIKFKEFNEEEIRNCVKKSNIYILEERMNIIWGDFSQIKCELELLDKSIKNGKYSYYHLLSGVDLPLKTPIEIHNFFDNCNHKEFIHFDSKKIDPRYLNRVNKYWIFTGRNVNILKRFLNKVCLILQFNINRVKKSGIEYQKGANWFSITDEFAKYIISQRSLINKLFKYTITADEMFLQTLIINSSFKDKIYYWEEEDSYKSIQREIDWKRGNPYIYREEDFNYLKSSPRMFARKFSWKIDSKVIEKLYEYLKENN